MTIVEGALSDLPIEIRRVGIDAGQVAGTNRMAPARALRSLRSQTPPAARPTSAQALGIGNRAWEELQRVSKLGFLSEYSTAKDGAKVTCTPSGAATTNRVVRAKGGVMAADRGKHGCGKPETQRRCRRVLVHFFPGADIELNRLVDPKSLVVDG